MRILAIGVLLSASAAAQALWTQVPGLPNPGPRWGHGMTYDAARGVVVLFGGYQNIGNGIYFNDTWTFQGTTWQLQNVTGARPSPRIDAAMCYDSVRQVVVLLGGGTTNETWTWNGTGWTQGPYAQSSNAYSMAFDTTRGVCVAFNGTHTLEWPGSGPWIQRLPTTNPGNDRGAMAFDAAAGRCLLLANGQTWHWNGVNWTQLAPLASPPNRQMHRIVFEPTTGRTILFGGYDGTNLADTWAWNGITWAQMFSVGTPPPRALHGMAFHGGIQRVVMFGGNTGLGDTWTKNATSATPAIATVVGTGCPGTAGTPQLVPSFGSLPWIGGTMHLDLQNLSPFPFWAPFSLAGWSQTQWLGTPLPLDLTPIGMSGCLLRTSLDEILPLTKVGTSAHWQIPIPYSAPLVGARLFLQGAVVEPPANPFGMILSNSVELTIGAI